MSICIFDFRNHYEGFISLDKICFLSCIRQAIGQAQIVIRAQNAQLSKGFVYREYLCAHCAHRFPL